jgi:ADP-heptose:LPS heptosyltransferase
VVAKPRDGSGAGAISAEQAPLMSLPQRLGGAPHAELVPYLRLPGCGAVEAANQQDAPRIGVVWAAGRKLDDPFTAREYRRRSLGIGPLCQLLEGLAGHGAQLTGLQVGDDRAMGLEAEQQAAGRWQWADQLAEDADFAATAAALGQLDLVITVDTAMAHLAGALGHPAWVLLPWSADPRWLRQRDDSVWYTSLRLWRQHEPDDWSGVVDALLDALPSGWDNLSCRAPG